MSLPKLGIIAGSGDLPSEIAKIYQSKLGDCVIASIVGSNNYPNILSKNFTLGSVGGIIKFFKQNNVENIILVGGLERPDLKSLKVDLEGGLLVAKILKQKFLGDDKVLKLISNYIESKGFRIISPKDILSLTEYKNIISKNLSPSAEDKADIITGIKVLKYLGSCDVGQSIIVYNKYVLGIEAAEGTDNLIKRCRFLRKKEQGGVLVKMSKNTQDLRLDTPVVGPNTIINLIENGFSGLAIEEEGVIIVKPEETMRLINQNHLFIDFI